MIYFEYDQKLSVDGVNMFFNSIEMLDGYTYIYCHNTLIASIDREYKLKQYLDNNWFLVQNSY